MTNNMYHYSTAPQPSQQKGAVLIVSLVMLTILTILAIGTTSDVGLQANMTKNSQINLRAFNASMGQLNTIFNDLQQENGFAALDNLLLTKAPILGTVTASASNPFQINTNIYQVGQDEDDSVGGSNTNGNQLGSATNPTAFKFEINSISTLPNTGLGSNQTYKVVYSGKPN